MLFSAISKELNSHWIVRAPMDILETEIKDFVRGGLRLILQRHAMYIGVAVLTAGYYGVRLSVICYTFCIATDLFDTVLSRRILKWRGGDERVARTYLRLLTLSSTLSALAVSFFAVAVSYVEGPAIHFTSLFFLFSAALFAAMNNHQLLQVLIVRLIIYGAAFLLIPLRDLFLERPPLGSLLWLQFFTAAFVLYFIIDCSRIYLSFYRRNLHQIEDLRRERDRVENALEQQSRFISIISHELRTPLTSIRGALGLARGGAVGELSPQLTQLIDVAEKNGVRLGALINDLLDLQKLNSGREVYRFSKVELNALVADAVHANEGYGAAGNVSIRFQPATEDIFVMVDPGRVMQVMANLLSNAIKFSNKNGIVDVGIVTAQNTVRVFVKDYGKGIPEGSNDAVFGLFTQVDSSDTRSVGGSGLGMNISKKIIEAHGGEIDYKSTVGEGTTFWIELKIAHPSVTVEPTKYPEGELA